MKKDLLGALGFVVGFLLYFILSCVDRFIIPIPDVIYIILMVVALILFIIGLITRRKNK